MTLSRGYMKRFFVIALLILSCSTLFASTWYVSENDSLSIKTIQAAIDSSISGDTILVKGAHQNAGPIEIIDKTIYLLSSNYINNPSSYSIASGAALFDSLNSQPLLTIRNADNSQIKGFLFDKSDVGNGGGVIIENSLNIIINAVHFNSNPLKIINSSVTDTNSQFYNLDSNTCSLISLDNSTLNMVNSTWKNNIVKSMLVLNNNSSYAVKNLANHANTCSSYLYDFNSSYGYFDFITSYYNESTTDDWRFSNSYVTITSSILENNPPYDIAQCEINYSSLAENFPGNGNIFINPHVDSSSSEPHLLDISPCISAADPDTNGIIRYDLSGKARPYPEWAPPDMGAYESERYMLLNDTTSLWVTNEGHDIWGNGSLDYPFKTLQAAVDYANNLDTILFKPGTYYSQATIDEKSLLISSEFVLNQDSTYRDSVVLIPDTSIYSPVIIARNIDSLKVFGLSLKNGSGRYFYRNYTLGGALYLETSNVYLKHLLFDSNQADFSGGAIYARETNLEMDKLKFKNNRAYLGGAITLSYSSTANISNILFQNNVASSGGAIFAENNTKIISFYSDFVGNTANTEDLDSALTKPLAISQYGGAIYTTNSELRFHNSLFLNNTTANKGAALALRSGKLSLLQSTMVNNQSLGDHTSTIYLKDQSDNASIVNSILWNENDYEIEIEKSDLDIINSCLNNGTSSLLSDTLSISYIHNLYTQNPQFDDDYKLSISSPYHDSGKKDYVNNSFYLFKYNNSEYSGNNPGLGYSGATPAIYFALNEYHSSIADGQADTYELLRAYPNPFNPTTTLEFVLNNNADTRLDLYDIRGRHVVNLLDTYQYSGKYTYQLNAITLSSGIYICRLSQNGITLANNKLLLVK